ncbi:cupin domain-containing protein [Massilia sp. RP-1-19]|uniref:Cupin domain-containing protein n=1 Tax=Massilia polaris TaxID=2728846 RepID=A0A848HP65_9BURK|nr:cupin domain-containing protein [Massilia polaris]NML62797.1 cupin domain-containing protein [Massilia polaris]
MKTVRIMTAALLLAGSGIGVSHAQTQAPAAPAANGGISRSDVLRNDLDAKREAIQVRVDFAPGAAFPMHNHPGVEIAYVLEGTLEYKFGSQPPVTLKAGQALFIPAGTYHSAHNPGSVKASELATYLVEKGKPLVVKQE